MRGEFLKLPMIGLWRGYFISSEAFLLNLPETGALYSSKSKELYDVIRRIDIEPGRLITR